MALEFKDEFPVKQEFMSRFKLLNVWRDYMFAAQLAQPDDNLFWKLEVPDVTNDGLHVVIFTLITYVT